MRLELDFGVATAGQLRMDLELPLSMGDVAYGRASKGSDSFADHDMSLTNETTV